MSFDFDRVYLDKLDQSFCDVVQTYLTESDYEDGQIERLESQLENTTSILSRLFLKLVEKQILNKKEIEAILRPSTLGFNKDGGYNWPDNPKKK